MPQLCNKSISNFRLCIPILCGLLLIWKCATIKRSEIVLPFYKSMSIELIADNLIKVQDTLTYTPKPYRTKRENCVYYIINCLAFVILFKTSIEQIYVALFQLLFNLSPAIVAKWPCAYIYTYFYLFIVSVLACD